MASQSFDGMARRPMSLLRVDMRGLSSWAHSAPGKSGGGDETSAKKAKTVGVGVVSASRPRRLTLTRAMAHPSPSSMHVFHIRRKPRR